MYCEYTGHAGRMHVPVVCRVLFNDDRSVVGLLVLPLIFSVSMGKSLTLAFHKMPPKHFCALELCSLSHSPLQAWGGLENTPASLVS